ncbi:DUF3298 and DUF4163 domain-containing protein [Robiginitalea aurantiaca]|uniref:DUF4163 domain-containing protein n=1 Tax=Robiginitalea aurantiaca TaxID=3056915 RepID=A0ABT7WEE0_9FLAO|nr:DUF3298 and DUF4163 domain-containing protein [Robiginitalea aurantiaca]MDM9631273.1 DUF4163 domain-containing protein [Robiginitalea aurantiaca]
MKRVIPICILFLLFSCASESTTELKMREYQGADCKDCPVVHISVPEASEKTALGKSINRVIREEIIELLDFDRENNAADIPGAIEAFTKGFQFVQSEFPEELTGWEASVEGTTSYDGPDVLTIKLDKYIFTGGAHGYGGTAYLNFDRETGEELPGSQLLRNPDEFSELAESAFRKKYDIPMEAPINSTGFMFEENKFKLPENIGLDAERIVLHYNPYEAASYADGALIIEIPIEEGLPYLKKGGN